MKPNPLHPSIRDGGYGISGREFHELVGKLRRGEPATVFMGTAIEVVEAAKRLVEYRWSLKGLRVRA